MALGSILDRFWNGSLFGSKPREIRAFAVGGGLHVERSEPCRADVDVAAGTVKIRAEFPAATFNWGPIDAFDIEVDGTGVARCECVTQYIAAGDTLVVNLDIDISGDEKAMSMFTNRERLQDQKFTKAESEALADEAKHELEEAIKALE